MTPRSRYYTGPVSDHFNGARFFDPTGALPRRRADLLRWMIGSRWRGTRAKWPASAPSPYVDHPPARAEDASGRISYVGHARWLVQTAGLNLLLDPVWSQMLLLLGVLVAKSLPQSRDCKIKEGAQLQRHRALAGVDNADRHR
jgi:hypothetical protein